MAKRGKPHTDLTGQRFNMLVVQGLHKVVLPKDPRTPEIGSLMGAIWNCVCDCGQTLLLSSQRLKGKTKSCGCIANRHKVKHGDYGSLTYTSWQRARQSREGTTEEWATYDVFKEDMGERPEGRMLMRIETSRPFGKSNCYWATRADISQNRFRKTYTFNDKTQSVTEWADELKLPRTRIQKRLDAGWTFEDAVTTRAKIQRLELAGQKFGKLTAIEQAGTDKHSRATWRCLCDCGQEAIAVGYMLKSGAQSSCGCLRNFQSAPREEAIHLAGTSREVSAKDLAKRMWKKSKVRAQQAEIPFNLDLEDVKVPDRCPILGMRMGFDQRDGTPTLDRFIPELGYTKGNVNVISWRANSLKKNGSIAEFKALVAWMEEEHGKRK